MTGATKFGLGLSESEEGEGTEADINHNSADETDAAVDQLGLGAEPDESDTNNATWLERSYWMIGRALRIGNHLRTIRAGELLVKD